MTFLGVAVEGRKRDIRNFALSETINHYK